MTKKAAIFLTHGMGDITKDEFEKRVEELSVSLKKQLGSHIHDRLIFKPIFFQDILQNNQDKVFQEIRKNSEIDWIKLRKFMLYSFSDAASLEHRAHQLNSVYYATQKRIFDALKSTYSELDEGYKNSIFVAHSLGCQVVSNYIWDSQVSNPTQGIWTSEHNLTDSENAFVRLKNMKMLVTTGCNIPIFVAGRNPIQSIKSRTDGYDFDWHNFYDEDDVLGWPLRPLGEFSDPNSNHEGTSYFYSVTKDHEINANGSFMGSLTKSWNPFSHGEYWADKSFIKYISSKIEKIVV